VPFSLPTFDDELRIYFQHAAHESVLDVGPGEGKFGKMLRDVQPSARRIAVEVDGAYVEQYGLREIYDEVLVMDAARLMDDVRRSCGAVILADVIEHLRKSVGIDLLHFLVYRSEIIFVKFPVQLIQDDSAGHVAEAHVSVWSELDFESFDRLFVTRGSMQLAVIRGYRNHAIEWVPQRFIQSLGYESCRAFYDEKPERWKLADRETTWRQRWDGVLETLIGPREKFILIDEEQSGLLAKSTRCRIPFLERHGEYFGMPADDEAALAELERQRAAGATWVVISENSFWATRTYPGLMNELRTQHRCELENDSLVVFRLRPASG
jgi:hypothetical protein